MASQQRKSKNLSDDGSLPCNHYKTGRNLIVCIDGTGNKFGKKNTNVIELYNLILKEDEDSQRTWYNSGIGTYAQPGWKAFGFYKQVYQQFDLAFAWGFQRTILAAYRWLSNNYHDGDCIFLFGFSRGAYQVRVLSAMIDKVGLIHKGNEMQIPFAYELYADSKSGNRSATEVGRDGEMSMADRFKNAFSYKGVKVHFVGAWDTVSSVGLFRAMLPGTVDGMKHVCYFRHALALDECRVKFPPEYAHGGTTLPREKNDQKRGRTEQEQLFPQTMEVWFAGTHSDIGGGNTQNVGLDRRKPPLRWMVFEAGKYGLRTAPHGFLSEDKMEDRKSLKGLWWLLEILPIRRLTFTRREDGRHRTYKPHLGSSRKIHPGQKFHSSLLAHPEVSYTPKARPIDDDFMFWTKLRTEGFPSELLEPEAQQVTLQSLKDYVFVHTDSNHTVELLYRIATSSDGRQAIYEETIEILNTDYGLVPEACHDVLTFAMELLGTNLRRRSSVEVYPLLERLLKSENREYRTTAQTFLMKFTDCITLRGDTFPGVMPWSIASSHDGKMVVLVSSKWTFQIWDVETGTLVGEYGNDIRSAACSQSCQLVVSGSYDGTVKIWDMNKERPMGERLDKNERHTGSVISVALSPDCRLVVSGSASSIRYWSVREMQQLGRLPLQGQPSMSVAISKDGKVVLGENDTVLIWDTKTKNKKKLQGHNQQVYSVSLSPDDKFITSASADGTVRIWDITEERDNDKVESALQVNSAAFSPCGRLIVSGGDDGNLRIWDRVSRKSIEQWAKRDNIVCSVAFSGKRIISCSKDMTARIWDVDLVFDMDLEFRLQHWGMDEEDFRLSAR